MNANEFRVGNKLQPIPNSKHIPGKHEITAIVSAREDKITVDYHYSGTQFEPLPITEGFLEKCEDYVDGQIYLAEFIYPSDGATFLDIQHEGDGKWSVYLRFKHDGIEQAIPIIKNISCFVHWLQNLYFAFTKKELIFKK